MKIVDLYNLSEEDRKKVLQEQQTLYNERMQKSNEISRDANQQFNNLITQQNTSSQQNNNASIWDKMQWLMKKYVNSAQSSVTNTIGSVPQSMAVGYNRAEKQAEKEQNTLDHIYNIGKNGIKVLANDPASRFLYNLTLGRDEYIDRLKEQATQLNNNFNEADGILKKTGAVIGGVTSNVLTENNTAVQQAYNNAQLNGSIYGKDYSKKQKEKMLELDENINKDAEKWSEELEKEGENYGKVTKFLGNASGSIGYMTPSILLTALTGGGSGAQSIGMAQMGLSAKGQATRQGLKEGLDIESADRKGVASGSAEVGSEFMFNGLKAFKTFKNNGVEEFARNWIEKSVENKIKSELGQKVTKGVGNWLVDVTGESIEELTTDIYNTWLDRATTNPNKEYTLEDATNTVLSTILSTTGLNAGNKVINTALNNDENANQQEYKKVVEENLKSQPQSTQNEQILPTQQVNQEQNKIAQNGNMEQILPTQNNVKENNLKGKSFEDIVDDAMNNYEYEEVKSPLQNRDINTIGKDTKTNAYQYDNPKVKPYFQQMAEMIGEDIGNIASPDNRKTQKGGGTVLNTNIPAIKQLKEMGYSYDQIIDGIVNIIDDHGKENNALSKKLEIIIDDQLRNGYTNSYGKYINPNQEYINLISNNNSNVTNNQLPTKQINLPTQENNIKNNNKDTNTVKQEAFNYLKKNNINMTVDEFVEWASGIELENEENMTAEQKELYSLISDIQNRVNMEEDSKSNNEKKYETVRLDNGKEYQRKEIRAFKDNDGHEFRLYELPNHHNELSIKETGKNQSKTIRGSRNEILKEIQKYWKGQGTFSDIANNQETLYNNSNESESGINGYKRDTIERGNRIYEEQKQQQNREYTWEEYNKWEQSIKPIETNQLTNNEQESINKAKSEYNKDVVLYDANNNDNTYSGGASQQTKNKITISRQSAEEFGLNKMIDHENVESDILHNDSARDILSPAIDVIMQDKKFNSQKENFWKGQKGNIPTDYLIAKDIICDRFSEIQQGEKLDYENVLSNATNSTIDNALSNYYKQVYGKELDIPSSFNLSENEKKPSRHEVIQQNRELARENIKNISKWKDKKRGLSYQLETMERNMYDIIPDNKEAEKINKTYFEPIHKREAQKQKFINKYNDKIQKFKLNKYESEAVQFLGEKKYNPEFNQGDKESLKQRNEIQTKIDENIKNGNIDINKVNNAIETFREIYDELFELENEELRKNGYKEKPYRKGYFPHFIDYVPETASEKILKQLGFNIDKRPLPTDIAGITEQFIPGKTWNKSTLERKTNKTDYNALKGFDTYIAQASDNIFHTENIQKLRGLENEIRYQYSDKGIQERIDNILNDESLYEDEKQDLIDNILKQVENPMPNLVTELRRYTNALANKKSEADRSIENMMGRSIYSTVNAIENKFGANAVGLNIGSAVTNFIPITQAYSQVSTKNMGRAMLDTIKSYVSDDGFIDKSAFLTSRIREAEKLYKTPIQKVNDKAGFLFKAIDEVTSNIVVRGKYLQNLQEGMNEIEAIDNADQFARNVIADRSKGALPTKFEEKNPISKAFNQFQLEVNNQYRYMFKDIPRDLKEKGLGAIILAFFKMCVGAWLYNEASEKITGRRPAFDPFDIITSAYKDIKDEKKGTYDKVISIGKNVAEDLPFVGSLIGGGRIPVNGALPDIGNVSKAGIGLFTGEMDKNKAISNIGKEVTKPLYYLLPPFGGAQIKKSVEGINTVVKGGSYGVDKNGEETLQFPVENANALDYVKAGVFGKYALPTAKDYTNNNYKSLNANQTKTYKESKIPYKEYIEYLNQDLKKNEDKINYINKQNWGENQKWGIYTNEIFSDTERKEGGSQLEDAKYAIKNGISKTEYMKLYNETNKRSMNLPTQEEQKELKESGISLKNYVNYQVKVHDETKKQKENGTLEENKQLKNKDKIEILLNSKYSNDEKEAIYKKSINSQDEKVEYLVDKLGFPLEQYLKYRQQEFKNDKNEHDETIKGSKKQKVLNYLNSIPDNELPREYKKIICQMEDNNDFTEDVANFINDSNNLTYNEKVTLLKKLNFEVNRDGKIKSKTMLPITKNIY